LASGYTTSNRYVNGFSTGTPNDHAKYQIDCVT
jgi:hypothetical protein